MLNRRLINFAGAGACLGMLAFAYYTQEFLNLEPCPLCIFQRMTVFVLAVVFLAAGIHNTRSRGGEHLAWGLRSTLPSSEMHSTRSLSDRV